MVWGATPSSIVGATAPSASLSLSSSKKQIGKGLLAALLASALWNRKAADAPLNHHPREQQRQILQPFRRRTKHDKQLTTGNTSDPRSSKTTGNLRTILIATAKDVLFPSLVAVYVVYPMASLWLFRLPESISGLKLFQNHHTCSQTTAGWQWKACLGLAGGHLLTVLPAISMLWLWKLLSLSKVQKFKYTLSGFFLGLLTFKFFIDHQLLFSLPDDTTMTGLSGKVAVITGANRGLGLATTLALTDRGAHVVVTCRTLAKCQPVVDEVAARGSGSAQAAVLDLSSLRSAVELAHTLAETYPRIHYFFCNAGTTPQHALTEQGLEDAFGGMHLAHMAVVLGILPNLERAGTMTDPARVVVVSSEMSINAAMGIFGNHLMFSTKNGDTKPTTLQDDMLDDWRGEKTRGDGTIGPGLPAYGRAKLCGVLFALELNRRMHTRNVIAHAVHTGAVVTASSRGSILEAFPAWIPALRWITGRVYFPLLWRTVEGGTQTILCPALSQAPYILQGGHYLDALCQPFFHDVNPDLSRRQAFTLSFLEDPVTIQIDPVQALLVADTQWSERLWNVSIAFLENSPAKDVTKFAP